MTTQTEREKQGRNVENVLAYGGFALFALYVVGVEIAPHFGLVRTDCEIPHHVPWGVLAGMIVCVAQKTLGRARAAGILDSVMALVPTRKRKVNEGTK